MVHTTIYHYHWTAMVVKKLGHQGCPTLWHIYIYIYIYRERKMCIYIYIYTNICVYVYIYIYICTYVCVYMYIYIYMHIYTHACMHIYIYIYIYIHTHTFVWTSLPTNCIGRAWKGLKISYHVSSLPKDFIGRTSRATASFRRCARRSVNRTPARLS